MGGHRQLPLWGPHIQDPGIGASNQGSPRKEKGPSFNYQKHHFCRLPAISIKRLTEEPTTIMDLEVNGIVIIAPQTGSGNIS